MGWIELIMIGQYKISVITATYNSVKTIDQAIRSVVGQSYDNIEYIIVDGGSTDGTVDIIKKYDDRISYWISEPDKGIYDAFCKGVAAATGDYIYFLGSDDCLCEKDTIEKIVGQIYGVDILSAGVWVVDEKYGIQQFVDGKKAEKPNYDYTMIPHQGMFCKRDLLVKYPFDLSYRISADYLFFMNCYHDGAAQIKYIDLPVAFYSAGGMSSVGTDKLLFEENNRVRRNFGLPMEQGGGNACKKAMKKFFEVIHIFEFARYVFNRFIRRTWVLHKCEWVGCRWCAQAAKGAGGWSK